MAVVLIVISWISSRGSLQVTYVNDYCKDVGHLIDGAKHDIKVALYLMRYSDRNGCPENLVRKIVKAKERGVQVIVFLDDTNYNLPAENYLESHGIEVIHPPGFLHSKVIKVDDCFVVGSHNWTWNAMHKNREASVIVCGTDIIDEFFREIEAS